MTVNFFEGSANKAAELLLKYDGERKRDRYTVLVQSPAEPNGDREFYIRRDTDCPEKALLNIMKDLHLSGIVMDFYKCFERLSFDAIKEFGCKAVFAVFIANTRESAVKMSVSSEDERYYHAESASIEKTWESICSHKNSQPK